MAALATSAVTIVRAWSEGGVTGKERSCRQVSLVLTAQGTVANPIPASVLGLTGITDCSNFVKSDNSKIAIGTPAADGSVLLLNLINTNAADSPSDLTGTYLGTVKGYVA